MRTLQVGRDEDVLEVVDRLGLLAGGGGDVELLVPADARIARTKVDLELVGRAARGLGFHPRVVSDDPLIKRAAVQAGMEVEAEGPPRRDPTSVQIVAWTPAQAPWQKLLSDLGGGVADRWRDSTSLGRLSRLPGPVVPASMGAILVGAVLLVPSARVTLTAAPQSLSTPQLQIQGGPTDDLHVRTVTLTTSVSGSFPVTGSQSSGAVAARGQVTYHDQCPDSSMIPSGTLLHTSGGTTFVQLDDVRIKQHKDADVDVAAQAPGAVGNVGSGQITEADLPPSLVGCISVTNSDPTTGGQDGTSQLAVTQSDLDQARAQLDDQVRQQVISSLQHQAGSGERASDQVVAQSVTFTPDHKAGDLAPQVGAKLTETTEGAIYSIAAVEAVLKQALAQSAGSQRLVSPGSVHLVYQVVDLQTDGRMTLQGHAEGAVVPRLDSERIRSHLAGRSVPDAVEYLRSLPVATAHLSQSPVSLPMLPWLGARIEVDYQPS